MHACVRAQSCPSLCTPMGCIPLGSFAHGIFQARILELVAFPPSRNPPHPGIESTFPASCILAGGSWENCLKHSRSSNHIFSDLNACDGWKETGKIFLGTYLSGLIAYKISYIEIFH